VKGVGALAVTVLSSLTQVVCIQAGDAVDRLKACSQFEGMERLKCVRPGSRAELDHQRDDLSGGL